MTSFTTMPSQWQWHQDITPNMPYEVKTVTGETLHGKFHSVHGCFYAGGTYNAARIVRFSEIEMLRALS